MEIYKEVQRLELENIKLKKENEMLKIKISDVSKNVRTLGLQNRKLKYDKEYMILEEFMLVHNISYDNIPTELIGRNSSHIKAVSDFLHSGYSIEESMELVNFSDKYGIEYGILNSLLYQFCKIKTRKL